MRYLISVQRELPNQWLVEARLHRQPRWNLTTGGGGQAGEIDLNGIPSAVSLDEPCRAIRRPSTSSPRSCRTRSAACCPARASTPRPIARSQLLRPYPQFGNVRTFDDDGTSRYNSAQFKVEKRFTHGYTRARGATPGRDSPSACSN